MDITTLPIVLSIIAIILTYLVYKTMLKPKNFPPGPIGILLLGSAHYLTKNPREGMIELAKKYGNVFSVKLCHIDIVCLTGYDANKELFSEKNKDITDRPTTYLSKRLKGKNMSGIAEAHCGPSWALNRKLFYNAMRQTDIGSVIQNESHFLIEEIEKHTENGKPIEISPIITVAILNVLSSFVFGDRYEYGQEKMITMLNLNSDVISAITSIDPGLKLIAIFPKIAKFWIPKSGITILEASEKLANFFEADIEEHESTFDEQNPRDFIDLYLNKMSKEKQDVDTERKLSKHDLKMSLYDLYFAGTETVKTTLSWCLLYLAGHQEIQEKIHEEIDQALGFEKVAKYEDRLRMPYTEATIHEIQRYTAGGTLRGVVRVATRDTKFKGYDIPKGTWFMSNLYSANYDEDKWKNPTQFDPGNFLNEDGKFTPRDAFLIWGGGPRICLGMSMAKQELFLFLVAVLQKFKIKPEADGIECNYESMPGLGVRPKSQKLRFTKRE